MVFIVFFVKILCVGFLLRVCFLFVLKVLPPLKLQIGHISWDISRHPSPPITSPFSLPTYESQKTESHLLSSPPPSCIHILPSQNSHVCIVFPGQSIVCLGTSLSWLASVELIMHLPILCPSGWTCKEFYSPVSLSTNHCGSCHWQYSMTLITFSFSSEGEAFNSHKCFYRVLVT